jgi:VWFA-related protein
VRAPHFLLALALLAFAAAGQQRPPQAPAPIFTANAHLVIVDVTVKDPKTGRPIEGLKPTDFTVLEDGKPQKISVFEFQKLAMDPEPPPPPPALADQKELPEDPKTVISTESPGHIQYHDKRLLVLFFDFTTMGVPEQLRAQDSALTFLDKQITSSDMVAILLNTGVVQVKTDFTADRDQLKSIVENLPIGDMSDLSALADMGADTEEDTGAAFVADETEFNIFNTDRKLQAIEDAVHMLATLPEKKVLLYISSGINKNGMDNQAQLEASINASVKANVAIYPIDARGLMADPPGGAASVGASRGTGIFNGSVYNSQRASINDSQETLSSLASETGGKLFVDNNDLSMGIVAAQQQFRSYYIVGYYTTNAKEDGRYRRITVKLSSNVAARIENRQGYYADKVWGKFNGQEKEQQLQDALSAGNPVTDIPIVLEADYFRITPTAYFVPLSIRVPGSVIALAQKSGGAGETRFDFIGEVIDERKTVVAKVRDFITVKLGAQDAAQLARRNLHYDAGFTLAPGKYRVKFLVRENQTGKMGTFDGRFIVPDLAADSTLLKVSSVVWSSQREPLKAAVGAAERTSRKTNDADPLIVGDEKIVPNISRVFRRAQKMFVTFDVYDAHPDPADYKARRVRVGMSLYNQKGVKTFEAQPLLLTQIAATRPEAVPVAIEVPLKDVAPGRYTCQLNIVDEVGRKFAFPRASLVVR